MNCHVYVDFDGTIVPGDATDTLFEAFATPQWRDVERLWQSGEIGSRECLARQVALLEASEAEMRAALANVQVDPAFPGFLAACEAAGIGVSVVSDGFDFVIDEILSRHGINVDRFANHLSAEANRRWTVTFPYSRSDCSSLSGHCKCGRTDHHPKQLKVVVGDGRSDRCIAERADLVLAKAKLLELCREAGKPCVPFQDFSDVTPKLRAWLAGELVPSVIDDENISGPKSGKQPAKNWSAGEVTFTT